MTNNKPGLPQQPADRDMARKELRRNQVFGVVLGVIGGFMSGNFWPALPAAVGWGGVLLWGAAIGAIIGSLGQFERAGKVLTRNDNRALNLVVGLAVPLLAIVALALILGAINR